ncbi:MAG: alpha/beta fold hydrolase [Alphaproteobacteria bacterium]|nr:alpha/beta fold hydrolase [Alphaproteobacteria bacterium]
MALELAYQAAGEGPPLIILHGLFGSGRNWTSIARRLGDRHRVYTLDLRNHGDSPWDPSMDYIDMAADVVAFMDVQGLETAAVIGHSMGGKAAMALALEQGARVSALVVVDIAPVTYDQRHLPYVRAMQAVDLAVARRRSEVDARLRDAIPDAGIRAFLLQNLTPVEGGAAWRLNLDALAAEMPRLVDFPRPLLDRRYTGPALFVAGARSDFVGAEHGDLIGRLFPRAVVETVADADHWVHADQPDKFVAAVTGFLDSTG